MLRVPVIAALVACALALSPAYVGAAAQPASSTAPAAADELIVRFSARADGSRRVALRDAVDAQAVRALPVPGSQLLRLTGDFDVDEAVARLTRSRDVLYAEPNLIRTSSATMNDPFFDQLWGLQNTGQLVQGTSGTAGSDISAPSAWDLTTGSAAAKVAVVDSGIASHPDLDAQIAINTGEIAGNAIDDDANGYPDDVSGWDFVDVDAVPEDEEGHGTHVSGTIAARGNDGVGVVGVAPSARIMPLRALDDSGSGYVSDIVAAYTYAGRNGARVVNASLGGESPSTFERDAIAAQSDVLFVVAAGNGGNDGVGDDNDIAGAYPCAYDLPNVVCVAATDSSDVLASFSNYGAASVDLAAPGVDILSDYLPSLIGTPRYAFSDGTSMATPHVAGAAALALALHPDASVSTLKQSLLAGTDARPSLAGKTVSGGRLNARRTLDLLADVDGVATPAAPAPAPATAPAPAPAVVASPVPPDATAPLASILLRARQRILTLRRTGLLPRVTCTEACAANAVLRLSAANARRARLGSGVLGVTIGRGQRALPSGVSSKLTVRLTSRASRALGRLRRPIAATLSVSFVDAAGNRRTLRKSVTLVASVA